MKKIFLSVLLAFTAITFASAQRHIKGVKQLHIGGGITGKGIFAELGYTQYLNNKIYISGSVLAEPASKITSEVEGGEVSYSSYSALIQGGYNLWNNETIFLNARAGVGLGIEQGKLSNKPVTYVGEESQNVFFVAGSIGGEIEYYLSDKFVVAPYFNQWILGVGGDKFGNSRFFGGLTLKFGINK